VPVCSTCQPRPREQDLALVRQHDDASQPPVLVTRRAPARAASRDLATDLHQLWPHDVFGADPADYRQGAVVTHVRSVAALRVHPTRSGSAASASGAPGRAGNSGYDDLHVGARPVAGDQRHRWLSVAPSERSLRGQPGTGITRGMAFSIEVCDVFDDPYPRLAAGFPATHKPSSSHTTPRQVASKRGELSVPIPLPSGEFGVISLMAAISWPFQDRRDRSTMGGY